MSESLSTRLRMKAAICRLIARRQPVDESLYPTRHPNRGKVRHIEFRDWLPPDMEMTTELAARLENLAECFECTASAVDLLRCKLTLGERRSAVNLLAEGQNMLQGSLRDTQHTAQVKSPGFPDQDLEDAYSLAREEARSHRWRCPALMREFYDPAQIGEVANELLRLKESVGF